jgi:hypothetical protein
MSDQNLGQSSDKSANLTSPNLRFLSPWNPLDHLRLLWWVLVTPQRLVAYREVFGKNAERSVGEWLVNTLAWLPLFIPLLALGLGTLPRIEESSTTYLGASVGLVVAWVLTGRGSSLKGKMFLLACSWWLVVTFVWVNTMRSVSAVGVVSALVGRDWVNGVIGVVVGLTMLKVAGVVESAVKDSLKTGKSSGLTRGSFGVLVLAYALLIWFSFLSGWQLFR